MSSGIEGESFVHIIFKAHNEWEHIFGWQVIDSTGFHQVAIAFIWSMLASEYPLTSLLSLMCIAVWPDGVLADFVKLVSVDSLL